MKHMLNRRRNEAGLPSEGLGRNGGPTCGWKLFDPQIFCHQRFGGISQVRVATFAMEMPYGCAGHQHRRLFAPFSTSTSI